MAADKKLPRFSGACLLAAAGLVLGNFLLYDSSAALADALSSRFGSNWFFTDLLASSLSPLGALLGLIFGFVLIDLPRLSLRQAGQDNFTEAAAFLRQDLPLQQAVFRLLGAQCAAGGCPNLLQRDYLLRLIDQLGCAGPPPGEEETADLPQTVSCAERSRKLQLISSWLAEGAAAAAPGAENQDLTAALLYINAVCRKQHLPSLQHWLCRRLADLSLCSVQLSPAAEKLFLELSVRLNLFAADCESLLHLKMENRAERVWTLRQQYLAAAWWNFGLLPEAEEKQSESADFSYRHSAAAGSLNELSLQEAMQILGVDALTPPAEIKRRYHRLMFKYHPDHQSGLDAAARAQAEAQALQIRLAYEIICAARQGRPG